MTQAALVAELLLARRLTLATAESMTGGRLGHLITSVPGASLFYRGGVISYATEAKRKVLGIDPQILSNAGAVSRESALAMATAVRLLFSADIGVATTGVAGPTEQDGQPVGTLFWAVSGLDNERCELLVSASHDREEIRDWAAAMTLHQLTEWIGASTG